MARESFVDAKQAFHAFHATDVHRPESSRTITRANNFARSRTVNAMVVERSQINRRECASFKAGGHVFVTEQVLERVGLALGLNQFLLFVESGRL